ncbi:hypothetical protein F5141DRAFT_1065526 [Pisolithus sp. B1]|nr:hypothetical protein F5141DRAFT_1065526 [Pisolithus sp. B1]
MNSQPEDSYGYPTDTDARQPMDDAGEELAEGPYGNFDVVELEVLAQRRREWTQVGKREKPSIMWEICNEFAKMEKHRDLRLVKWQEKEEAGLRQPNTFDLYQQALSAFIHEDLTDEQQQAADDIMDKWNGSQGPTPEVQAWNAKKYGLKYMRNFAEEMWQMKKGSFSHTVSSIDSMDFNNDIRGSSNFDNIHTISASWREYLGNAYEDPDIDAGGQVPNMAANHPRAKMGDPVKVVTNDKGDIRIGDLNGHNHDSILQMCTTIPVTCTFQLPWSCSTSGKNARNGWIKLEICSCQEMEAYSHCRLHENGIQNHGKPPSQQMTALKTTNDDTDTEDVAIHKMNIVELSSRGKSHDPRCSHKKTPMPVRQPTQLATDDEEQHEVMSTEDEVAGNEALPVVKQPSTSWQSTIQHKGSQVTAELPDTSGYIDDDKFDSMPFTDVCTTQSGPSGQHHKGGKLKSALKHHVRCEQNNVEPQPNLKTSSNPQQSIAKATKRHQAANDHPSPLGPSTEEVPNEVQPWKSP